MNRLLLLVSNGGKGQLLPTLILVMLAAFMFANPSSAATGSHHEQYLEALHKVTVAQERIATEMGRISNNTVAHYDFLQHEHIELLRHARALRHPPSQLPADARQDVIAQAEQLLLAAESLELVIADFLRAQAIVRSALSNTQDLVVTQPVHTLASADLQQLQTLAIAAAVFKADDTPATLLALDSAFDSVQALPLEPVRRSELLAQQQMLRNNASQSAGAMNRLVESNVALLAKALEEAYLAAHNEH